MRFLIVEDDFGTQSAYQDNLEDLKIDFDFARSYDEAVDLLNGIRYDAAVVDHRLAGKKTGADVVQAILDRYPRTFPLLRASSLSNERGYPPGVTWVRKTQRKLFKLLRQWVETGEEPDWYEPYSHSI